MAHAGGGGLELARLARTAQRLGASARARNPGRRRLPDLWLFTDPDRTPDPLAAAARLPRGSGVVLRTFGRPEVEALAPSLARLARAHGLVLLVGADAALAARIGADGVHLPERLAGGAPALRRRRPGWIVTVAAHGPAALRRAARLSADAAFLSPVLPSRSPSGGAPLGPVRAGALAARAGLPAYALGGMDARTSARLVGTSFAGVAAVEALRT